MFKKQMLFQKIVCMLALICGALVFIYSLGIMTDIFDCLYSTIADQNYLEDTYVTGSRIYYDMQGFNRKILSYSIVLIVLACALFVFQTNKRRKYYIANYITTFLFVAFDLFLVVWGHFQIEHYKAQWLMINFEELKTFSEIFKTAYTESTFCFDIHYGIFGLCLIEALCLIVNLIWKNSLVKREQRLLQNKGEKVND